MCESALNIISSYTATSSKLSFPSRFADGDPYHLPNVAAHLAVFDLFTLTKLGKNYNSEGLETFNRAHAPITNAQYSARRFHLKRKAFLTDL